MESEDVADVVLGQLSEGMAYDDIMKMLLHRARQQWNLNEEAYCDDITAILASLNGNPGPEGSAHPYIKLKRGESSQSLSKRDECSACGSRECSGGSCTCM